MELIIGSEAEEKLLPQSPDDRGTPVLYSYKAQVVRRDVFLFIISILLFQSVELLVMFTITMSNERMNLDAPVLNDAILSLIPKQPFAAKWSEVLLISYQIIYGMFVLFHKRRFALARRFLVISSICYLIRIVCIWANVLPRSHVTMECLPKATGPREIFERMMLLWGAAGVSIFGGNMCGNYFFSGHALMATINYYHLAHYMPSKWCVLHKLNSVLNLSIAALILSAHNHYTLDIIGSFVVGNWVFKLYTFIAENQKL